jgi:hypothetical protein
MWPDDFYEGASSMGGKRGAAPERGGISQRNDIDGARPVPVDKKIY